MAWWFFTYLEENVLWRQIFKSSFRLTLEAMLKGHIQWIVLNLPLQVNCRQKMTFLSDYSPFPGLVEHSPRSTICIVSLNVLSLDLLLQFWPWPCSILNLFFLTFMPRFQWIPAFPCAVNPLISTPGRTLKHRKQKTAYTFKKIIFFCINLSLNALCSSPYWPKISVLLFEVCRNWKSSVFLGNIPILYTSYKGLLQWVPLALAVKWDLVGNCDLYTCWKGFKIFTLPFLFFYLLFLS